MSSLLRRIGRILALLLAFLGALVILGTVLQQPILLGLVPSRSMEPALQKGDLIVILPRRLASPVGAGSIVVFQNPENRWTVHRIVGGNRNAGFITQGDHNLSRGGNSAHIHTEGNRSSGPVDRTWSGTGSVHGHAAGKP